MFIYFYTNTVPIFCIHKHCVVYILYLMLGVFFSVLHPQFFTCFLSDWRVSKNPEIQLTSLATAYECYVFSMLVISYYSLFYELHWVFLYIYYIKLVNHHELYLHPWVLLDGFGTKQNAELWSAKDQFRRAGFASSRFPTRHGTGSASQRKSQD